MKELIDCAFEAIILHPGCQYEEWMATMLELYIPELVDVFGSEESDIEGGLAELWATPYQPEGAKDSLSIYTWSLTLKDQESIREYFDKCKESER